MLFAYTQNQRSFCLYGAFFSISGVLHVIGGNWLVLNLEYNKLNKR